MDYKMEINNQELEQLGYQAFMMLYVSNLKELGRINKARQIASEAQMRALETHAGSRTHANHKNDMKIRLLNTSEERILRECKTINDKYGFYLFEENNIHHTNNEKTISKLSNNQNISLKSK